MKFPLTAAFPQIRLSALFRHKLSHSALSKSLHLLALCSRAAPEHDRVSFQADEASRFFVLLQLTPSLDSLSGDAQNPGNML